MSAVSPSGLPETVSPSEQRVDTKRAWARSKRSMCICCAKSTKMTSSRDGTKPHRPCPHGERKSASPFSTTKRTPSRLKPHDHAAAMATRPRPDDRTAASVGGEVRSEQLEKQRRAGAFHTKSAAASRVSLCLSLQQDASRESGAAPPIASRTSASAPPAGGGSTLQLPRRRPRPSNATPPARKKSCLPASGPCSHGPVPRRRRRTAAGSASASARVSSAAAIADAASSASSAVGVSRGPCSTARLCSLRAAPASSPAPPPPRASPAAGGGGRPSRTRVVVPPSSSSLAEWVQRW
mmetsp:Transcript_33747/g.108810  ORF Transcript_33747/g.108810 Transcript_33747/m.108810 type:complete len:295 (-) Transcript_33747:1490-2374(-)